MVIVVVEILGPGPAESIRLMDGLINSAQISMGHRHWPVAAEIPCRPAEVPYGCDSTIALKPSNGRSQFITRSDDRNRLYELYASAYTESPFAQVSATQYSFTTTTRLLD